MSEMAGGAGQTTGATNIAGGAQTAMGGTSAATQAGQASYLQSLGQPVPQGVELAGMTGPNLMEQGNPGFSGPGFWDGLLEGFSGTLGKYQDPSAATQFGQGFGQLAAFIDRNRGGGGGGGGGGGMADPSAWLRSLAAYRRRGPSGGAPVGIPETKFHGAGTQAMRAYVPFYNSGQQ